MNGPLVGKAFSALSLATSQSLDFGPSVSVRKTVLMMVLCVCVCEEFRCRECDVINLNTWDEFKMMMKKMKRRKSGGHQTSPGELLDRKLLGFVALDLQQNVFRLRQVACADRWCAALWWFISRDLVLNFESTADAFLFSRSRKKSQLWHTSNAWQFSGR